MRWLYRGAPPDRVGRVWRALVGYGRPLSTAELFAYCYPALDFNNRQAHWRWMAVRYAAERYGERVEPRTRPLRWQPSQASFWTVEPEQRIYSQVLSASFGRAYVPSMRRRWIYY